MSAGAPAPAATGAPAIPRRGRVLVLAPQAADEVLGCGGTLALHAERGDRVRARVAWEGAADAVLPEPGARRREARAAARRLGVRDHRFLGLPEDGALAPLATALAAELRDFAPDLVYAPWPGEQQARHRLLARAARVALCGVGYRGVALAYELRTPLVPTRVVDVSAVFDCKLVALCAHASLRALSDLLHAAAGGAAQRSLHLGPRGRQGEAFAPLMTDFPADAEELACLARLLRADTVRPGAEEGACTSRS